MKNSLLIILLLNCLSSIGQYDSTRVDLYTLILEKVVSEKSSFERLICIDDSYFDIEPRGFIGIVHYPDSLQMNPQFREDLMSSKKLINFEDTIYFKTLPNYYYINEEFRLQYMQRFADPFELICIGAPINDVDLYRYMYQDFQSLKLTFPIHININYNAQKHSSATKYYSVKIVKKNQNVKFKIKEMKL